MGVTTYKEHSGIPNPQKLQLITGVLPVLHIVAPESYLPWIDGVISW